MGKVIENFRDDLVKFAEVAESLENTFIKNKIEIKSTLDNETFSELIENLDNNSKDSTCVISIGNVDFIFLRK